MTDHGKHEEEENLTLKGGGEVAGEPFHTSQYEGALGGCNVGSGFGGVRRRSERGQTTTNKRKK